MTGEIEGDAVRYHAPRTALDMMALLDQCETMDGTFHRRIEVIERDSICPCGACQSATHLTLTFVVHHGLIKEIAVADSRKAAGVDMIVAHRLLENSVPSKGYLLVSAAHRAAAGGDGSSPRYTRQAAAGSRSSRPDLVLPGSSVSRRRPAGARLPR